MDISIKLLFFFFQAEDGIRDLYVTGVQTCALPICRHEHEHEHGPECGCGHDHEHSVVHLWQAVLGVVCVLNAFIVDWLFEAGTTLASASAMIGALILIYPIVVTAVKDLRVGRLSINELVAIAVLAAFASGDYKT